MNDFAIKPATRQGIKPLVGFYSESGNGKTYSSLLLARGLVGPTGKIVMIDTESGRGSLYADVLPGGYDVIQMTEPFSPARYLSAIQAVENSDAGVLIIDSASHEWEGLGGVLDMAVAEEERGMKGLGVWKKPKMEHAKMMLKLLQTRLPVIVCLRAKHKSRQAKNERGKTEIVKDDFTTPIQADDFIYEMTLHGEIMPDHSLRITKYSHPTLKDCFPTQGPITVAHGEALARWCQAAGSPAPKPTAPTSEDPIKTYQKQLWNLCKDFRGTEKSWAQIEAQLVAWNILSDTQTIKELSAVELEEVIGKLEVQLTINQENQ